VIPGVDGVNARDVVEYVGVRGSPTSFASLLFVRGAWECLSQHIPASRQAGANEWSPVIVKVNLGIN
jgi:hypothetical protein